MSALDLLSSAEFSSDLQHHSEFCAIDVVRAAGLAALHTPTHFIVYRAKYLGDAQSIPLAKSVFIRWTAVAMKRRGLNAQEANRLGLQALTTWMNDVCPTCNGRKHQLLAGTPSLTAKVCEACNGTGKPPMTEKGARADVVHDVMSRADSAVLWIQRCMDEKLGRG